MDKLTKKDIMNIISYMECWKDEYEGTSYYDKYGKEYEALIKKLNNIIKKNNIKKGE